MKPAPIIEVLVGSVISLLVALLVLSTVLLTGCGGGNAADPEQQKADPSPNCAMRPEVCK